MKTSTILSLTISILTIAFGSAAKAETGYDAWLRYAAIDDPRVLKRYESVPACVVTMDDSLVVSAARDELVRGIRGMLMRTLRVEEQIPAESAIVLGTLSSLKAAGATFPPPPPLKPEGYWLTTVSWKGKKHLAVAGMDERGVLYGVFDLLRRIALHADVSRLNVVENPAAPIRFLNHWDNLDGSIERGYAGDSIFWEKDHVVSDLSRVRDYARMMASVGINGCSINNVNADARVVTKEYLPEVARIAEAFRPWGVRMLISLDFASPRKIGGIDTFDPLDPRAVEFWKRTVDDVYRAIPDLAGFVLKADSEGRLGPSEYGRTHADAANAIARALKPYGGVLFYRGFVYNHRMDWRDLSLDRAKAAYDNFHPLDGKFEDNVIIQIKHGPIDFQVREPASPLFGALEKTSQAIEFQITQEYLGQQRHLCYLVPMWKEVLDFDMHAKGPKTPVKDLVAGKTFNRPTGGFVAVSNVGRDTNWLHHHLAVANLYGFGRLAWNPNLSSERVAEEWTRLTFGHQPRVVNTIVDMQLKSWPAYENYSGNLGIGTLTDIIHIHFGPAPESSEYNGWGQWHRSSRTGTGMNRSIGTGTGYIGQYREPVARMYESLRTCPDELLLFMHHVPYTHVLRSGKTVIQHFYDAHYEGAEQAARFVEQWKRLKGLVDEQRFGEVLALQEYQAGHAIVWRDAVNNWFFNKSGIPDRHNRVGNHPNRLEAESLQLDGYEVFDVVPFEAASGARAVRIPESSHQGAIKAIYNGRTGWFDIIVQYFDEDDGVSDFDLFVAGQRMDSWKSGGVFPSSLPDSHTSNRRTVRGVALRPGDEILLRATAADRERACVDYFEIVPHSSN